MIDCLSENPITYRWTIPHPRVLNPARATLISTMRGGWVGVHRAACAAGRAGIRRSLDLAAWCGTILRVTDGLLPWKSRSAWEVRSGVPVAPPVLGPCRCPAQQGPARNGSMLGFVESVRRHRVSGRQLRPNRSLIVLRRNMRHSISALTIVGSLSPGRRDPAFASSTHFLASFGSAQVVG